MRAVKHVHTNIKQKVEAQKADADVEKENGEREQDVRVRKYGDQDCRGSNI